MKLKALLAGAFKISATIEALLVGALISSLLITGTDHWKGYLIGLVIIHSIDYWGRKA